MTMCNRQLSLHEKAVARCSYSRRFRVDRLYRAMMQARGWPHAVRPVVQAQGLFQRGAPLARVSRDQATTSQRCDRVRQSGECCVEQACWVYWQPGNLKLPMRVCQPAVEDIWPDRV